MSLENSPQNTIKEQSQTKKILEIQGHGTIEMKDDYDSKDFGLLTNRAAFEASKRLSVLKKKFAEETEIKITGVQKHGNRHFLYTLGEILLLLRFDQELRSRWGYRTGNPKAM